VIIDASHRAWIRATLALFILSTAAYVPYHLYYSPNGPRGGSWPGLAFAIVGTILMLYAAAIGVRRKLRSWQLGRATSWLKGHIWLGLLSYPLIWFHAGFRMGGALTIALMVLFTIVVVTGIHGLVVQHIVPRLITVQIPVETMYEQVGVYVARLHEEASRIVTEVCGPLPGAPAPTEGDKKAKKTEPLEGSEPLKQFYAGEVSKFLEDGRGRLAYVASRGAVFGHVKKLVPPTLHPTLAQLEGLCEERRELSTQVRLHHWLHGWLIIHLPAAAALVVLTAVHAVASLYY
jgi:hypothetical protein